MAYEFQRRFEEAMREAELADIKKQVDNMTSQAQSYASFDPVAEVRRELDSTQQQIESAMAEEPAPTTSPPVGAEPSAGPAIAPSTEVAAPSSGSSEPTAAADAAKPDGKPTGAARTTRGRSMLPNRP